MADPVTTPPTYSIRFAADFLAVPIERLADCLEEFKIWLAILHAQRALLGNASLLNDPSAEFRWLDDGKKQATVAVSGDGKVLHRETFSMEDLGHG